MNHTITPDLLRFIRQARNMTQQQLATLIVVDQTLIGKIESGERNITPDVQRRLNEALDWQSPLLQNVLTSLKQWRNNR